MLDWSENELELASAIGSGRQFEIMTASGAPCTFAMHYAQTGGDGLTIHMRLNGEAMRLWVDEREWCAWLSPQLTVPDHASTPEELREALGHWACAPLSDLADRLQLAQPVFVSSQRGHCDSAFGSVLTMQLADASLRLRVLEGPQRWLHDLALALDRTAAEPRNESTQVNVALAAGSVRLTRDELGMVQSGATVVLDLDARVEEGEVWLAQTRPVARIRRLNEQEWTVENVFKNRWEQELAGDEAATHDEALDALNFTLVAEIGRIDLSFKELRELSPGSLLGGSATFDGVVTLRAGGQALAQGRLIRVGDRLAVRID